MRSGCGKASRISYKGENTILSLPEVFHAKNEIATMTCNHLRRFVESHKNVAFFHPWKAVFSNGCCYIPILCLCFISLTHYFIFLIILSVCWSRIWRSFFARWRHATLYYLYVSRIHNIQSKPKTRNINGFLKFLHWKCPHLLSPMVNGLVECNGKGQGWLQYTSHSRYLSIYRFIVFPPVNITKWRFLFNQ